MSSDRRPGLAPVFTEEHEMFRQSVRSFVETHMTPHADAWERHVATLKAHGIPEPGTRLDPKHRPATQADEQALYDVAPSFVDLLPWVEYLADAKSLLLEDGESVAAFFELTPIGTEGRESDWLWQARDALETWAGATLEPVDDLL